MIFELEIMTVYIFFEKVFLLQDFARVATCTQNFKKLLHVCNSQKCFRQCYSQNNVNCQNCKLAAFQVNLNQLSKS